MAKHHPDLIFCRKQPGVGKEISAIMLIIQHLIYLLDTFVYGLNS